MESLDRVERVPVLMALRLSSGSLKTLFWVEPLGDPNEGQHFQGTEIPAEQPFSLERECWMTSLCFRSTAPSFRIHSSLLWKSLPLCCGAHFPKGGTSEVNRESGDRNEGATVLSLDQDALHAEAWPACTWHPYPHFYPPPPTNLSSVTLRRGLRGPSKSLRLLPWCI